MLKNGPHIVADIVIVGAGLIGSSTAMHLSSMVEKSIAVVDLDLAGIFSSSELNAGGVRATWNHPVNASLSKFSIDYYESISSQIGFLQRGYTWMYPKQSWERARSILQSNDQLSGLGIQYLSPGELNQQFPFIDKTEDLGGATYSPKDGLLNPNLLKLHYREKARHKGVVFRDRIWIHGAVRNANGSWSLRAWQWSSDLSEHELKDILLGSRDKPGDATPPLHAQEVTIEAGVLVNCSGAWARRFAGLLGVACVSQPLRRQVSLFDCKEADLSKYGMFVDSSGVYFHPEGTSILSGYATPDEPNGYNLDYDGEEFFNERIWPSLYERSTKFENLKHVTGWAGLYEVSPDHSAIIGKVAGLNNVFEAHSFSGRGAMQSYGAGLGVAELIAFDKYQTLNLQVLSGERFALGQSVAENLII